MRLIDRVRALDPGIPEDLPVIVADPVAEQLDQMPGDTWSYSAPAEAYGRVAPPFTRFWVEAQTVVDLHEIGIQPARQYQVIQRGVLIEVEDARDGFAMRQIPAPDDTRWRYTMTPYIWYEPVPGAPGEGEDTVNGRIFLHLDAEGQIIDDMLRVRTAVFDNTELTSAKMRSYVSFLPFVLKSLSVLHQRTVVERITYTRQQKRMHQRKHGRLPADYYLLTVQPAVIVDMDDVAQPVQANVPRRQHIVRGHFRYYSPERPLFGRYSGMVWVGEHSRGDAATGNIDKGYLIQP